MEEEIYYINQAGTGATIYTGVRYQRGNGFLGRWFSKALSKILPVLKYAGEKSLQTAVNVGADVIKGESLKESSKKRLKETADEILDQGVDKIASHFQKGKGKVKSKVKLRKPLLF